MDVNDESFSFLDSEPSLMDMSISYYTKEKKKKTKKKLIILLSFLSLCVIIEYFTRETLKKSSKQIFGSKNNKNCELLEKFDFYNYSGRYILLFYILNFVNLYAAIGFIFLDMSSVALSGIINFFYLEPRPFWEDSNLKPCHCDLEYTGASTTGTQIFIILISFYHFITYKTKEKFRNDFILLICCLLIILMYLIRLLQNLIYLNQIFLGLCIGFSIYYWFFNIVKVDCYNRKQFKQIINQPILVISMLIIFWILFNIIHVNINLNLEPIYILNIQKYCKKEIFYSLDFNMYTKSMIFFEFLGCYLGIYLEYKIIFKENIELFIRYNIKSKYNELFNKTSKFKSFIRFLIYYLLEIIIFKNIFPYNYKIKNNLFEKESFTFQIFLLFFLTIFKGIFFFFILKRMIIYLKLTNEKIHQVMINKRQDSLVSTNKEEEDLIINEEE